MDHPLDNVVWAALTGPQVAFAQRSGSAVRYLPDVSPFAGLPTVADDAAWAGLAALAGAAGPVVIVGPEREPPPGWTVLDHLPGVQLDGSAMVVEPDLEAVVLGPADVPEMLDLVARTRPGPFFPRTRELGSYLGLRDDDGRLVAMAGERMRPPGWAEISAVCTDPAHRGRGLAHRLVRAVGAVIRDRGEVPYLHTGVANLTARRLYAQLGFVQRRTTHFTALLPPGASEPTG